jgi:ferredoxin
MAYVITERCTKDEKCIEVCPVDCIRPLKVEPAFEQVPQLYIDPVNCIDCGACIPVCEASAIFILGELPDEFAAAAEQNARYFA